MSEVRSDIEQAKADTCPVKKAAAPGTRATGLRLLGGSPPLYGGSRGKAALISLRLNPHDATVANIRSLRLALCVRLNL